VCLRSCFVVSVNFLLQQWQTMGKVFLSRRRHNQPASVPIHWPAMPRILGGSTRPDLPLPEEEEEAMTTTTTPENDDLKDPNR
jgi:hypothetical protein